MATRTGALSVLTVQADTVLVLSSADAVLLGELLLVAQTAILGVAASAEARPIPAARPMLDRLHAWASSAADLRERLKGGMQ